MEIIIEEVSRGHKVISRQRFAQSHVAIGRGYHNDIILTDPHICAEHLILSFDGDNWRVKDLDSINGSYLGEGKKSADGHIVHSGDVIRLGKSQVRVLFPHHPVSDSITLSPFENLINATKQPAVLIFNIALFTFITGWIYFLNNPKDVNLTQYLVPAAGITLVFAIWPIALALVSHLTKHDARIWTQLGVCFVFYNLTWLSDILDSIIKFNSASNSMLPLLAAIFPIALAFMLFWLNTYIGFHANNQRRTAIAAGLTILLFGGTYLIQLSKQPEFSVRPKFESTLMTPSFLVTNSSTVDDFLNNSDKLFLQVDKAVKENK